MGGVTEDYFAILGAPLELGRLFLPDEYAGGSRVLLSHASWTSRYGSDPDILGKSIPVDSGSHGGPATVRTRTSWASRSQRARLRLARWSEFSVGVTSPPNR